MAIVVAAGGKASTPDHRLFHVHFKVWPELLALGETHGWRPTGTRLGDGLWSRRCDVASRQWVPWPADSPRLTDHSYECRAWGKAVSVADAAAWADALEQVAGRMRAGEIAAMPEVRPALIGDQLTATDLRQANSPISPEFLDEFVTFLRRGGFTFFWHD